MVIYMNKIKEIFKNKINVYIGISIIIVIVLCIFMISLTNKHKVKEATEFSKITNIYPNDVRQIFSDMIDVSCGGDLKFDIKLGEELDVKDIKKDNLLMYMFSYMDKNHKIYEGMDASAFTEASNRLFGMDIMKGVKSFRYNDKTYTFGLLNKNKVKISDRECVSDNNHVSALGGYSFDEDELYIDVKIGYTKDDKLYDYENNLLGEYDGDRDQLNSLMVDASYYRFTYVKKNGNLVLSKIKFMKLS